MKYLKTFECYKAEPITEEISLKKAIVGGAIGAASLMNPSYASEPAKPDSISATSQQASPEADFLRELESEKPELFTTEDMRNAAQVEFGKFERVSFLEKMALDRESRTGEKIDLSLLSAPSQSLPFRINYFYVRGLDNTQTGPFLIRILNIDFNKAIEIGGHKVFFNFTRTDINSFGARIEL